MDVLKHGFVNMKSGVNIESKQFSMKFLLGDLQVYTVKVDMQNSICFTFITQRYVSDS